MRRQYTYILIFIAVFFASPLILRNQMGFDISPLGLLLKLPIFLSLGLLALWFVDQKSEPSFLKPMIKNGKPWLQTISVSFLLLSVLYLLKSVGNVTYAHWLGHTQGNPEILSSLNYIVSKPYLGLILVGPFVWLNVLFIEVIRAYFHTYLSSFLSNKWEVLIGLIVVPLVLSSIQIDSSLAQFMDKLLANLVLSMAFVRLRDIKPIIIASVIFQSIDLITFWVYA